ncbi:EFR1 family ferrodoxin [Anaerofustis stercorihominis]|uniref:EFR1 family ferrodoxin n=1 Tax=Anaerofustis stercorihominis TaxID=214853 RepID=UPI0026711E14|nr:EFR1 family ferrodoxin [Anaerofustis stercorihominis]
MNISKVNNLFFSPTGGSEKIAKIIAGVWENDKVKNIDISIYNEDYGKYEFGSNELCIITVPSFGGRVPNAAMNNISKIKGDHTPALLVVSYGNRAYDDTLLELKETLNDNGFLCFSAIAAVAEHSIMHIYGKGRPDEDDKKELITYSKKVKDYLADNDEIKGEVNIPGNYPYKEYNGVPIKPKASDKCSECGLCAKRCPVGAIPLDNPKLTDKEKCISCIRCIEICPNNARSVNKVMLAASKKKLKKVCENRKNNDFFIE